MSEVAAQVQRGSLWEQTQCEACGDTRASVFVSIPDYMTYDGIVPADTIFDILRCEGCGHGYPKQRLARDGLRRIYERGQYVAMAVYNDPKNESRLAEIGRIFAQDIQQRLGRNEVASLFEIGASFGHLLDAARNLGFDVRGIEPSAEAAKQAREKRGLDVTNGTIEDADLGGRTYDAIVAISVIEHVYDLDETVRKLKAAMHAESLFYVEVPCFDSLPIRLKGKRYVLGSVAKRTGIFHPVEHVRYFTAQSMDAWLRRHFDRVERVPDPRWGTFYRRNLKTELLSRILRASPTGNIVFAASAPRK